MRAFSHSVPPSRGNSDPGCHTIFMSLNPLGSGYFGPGSLLPDPQSVFCCWCLSHGSEWMTHKVLFISAAFCFCDIFMNASKSPPFPSPYFFYAPQLRVYSCGMRRIVFCQSSRPFLFVIVLPTVQAKTHTHGDMAGKPFSTQICSISNGSTTISVFFRLALCFFSSCWCCWLSFCIFGLACVWLSVLVCWHTFAKWKL